MKNKITAVNKEHLKELIKNEIELHGNECNLNYIDVANIKNMSELFKQSQFNGDISQWDVSNVTDMNSMFFNSAFNGDISKWDVSSVENMNKMFYYSIFNRNISQWDVSNVRNMEKMFVGSSFSYDLNNWQPYSLDKIDYIFLNCKAPIHYWLIEDINERNKAIELYTLAKELENQLSKNNRLIKKIKI